MKKLLSAGLALLAFAVSAQELKPAGGGSLDHLIPRDEMPVLVRDSIERSLAASAAQLIKEGKLAPPRPSTKIGGLVWPMVAEASYTDPDYHGISNYVDLNAAFPNQLLDWNCGARTYDQAGGYNHAGIDYYLTPFAWRMMDSDAIQIVASAPGTIIYKNDGNNDRSCPNNYSANWNAVYVQHGDGSVLWYGHMQLGSLTTTPVGGTVAAGEYLGLVGSSGFSTGPHLHLEYHVSSTPGSAVVEPHQGACNGAPSLWASQRPYRQSRINKLASHSAPPDFNVPCPNPTQETPNFQRIFQPGQTVYLASYYHDQELSDVANMRLLRPNGSQYSAWQLTSNGTYNSSYWYWTFSLPSGSNYGRWTWEVDYESTTYRHHFYFGDILFADGYEP